MHRALLVYSVVSMLEPCLLKNPVKCMLYLAALLEYSAA